MGVDAIMSAAGLTRGGFYGHFPSKRALFAEVLRGEQDFVRRLRARRGPDDASLRREASALVQAYLAPDHRDRVAAGCSIASLALDAARAGRPARRAYGDALEELAVELERGLRAPRHGPGGVPDERALATIALCVGGLLVSRAVDRPELADAVSAAAAEAAARELAR